ncbi:Kinase A inhibitor [Corynebacterium ciconiae DSM 44920]|uniref:5-oxoprolinase subunit B family protein n=1 Tax=Corynebacterium ciconiae TaxID=227319 RepID=UPI00037DA090|nr:allophanate hydrolase subunit 1 [Corynebacterium ciconiae]WKD61539.1 Kinase A inhibitor [Corynebacterium ciconiae DSM 44920]
MNILPCGDSAILLDVSDSATPRETVAAAHHSLKALDHPGIIDVVPAATTVLLHLDPRLFSVSEATALCHQLPLASTAPIATGSEIIIPVRYDGPDIAEVAAQLGIQPADVAIWHSSRPWHAAFGGFAPGFCYLVNDEQDAHDIARKSTPRPRIPAGSVAVAGGFSAVYPAESPGGWQLIGSTTATMWCTDRSQPALVMPGDRVRFVPTEKQ